MPKTEQQLTIQILQEKRIIVKAVNQSWPLVMFFQNTKHKTHEAWRQSQSKQWCICCLLANANYITCELLLNCVLHSAHTDVLSLTMQKGAIKQRKTTPVWSQPKAHRRLYSVYTPGKNTII